MLLAKNILIFGFLGLALSLVIFGLSNFAPSAFGWLTAPFWVLPALGNLGAHDAGWPLFLFSGTLCYGLIAFLLRLDELRDILRRKTIQGQLQ